MISLSKVAYGPEHLNVRDLAGALSETFAAGGLDIAREAAMEIIRTAVESRNRTLQKRPDGNLVVHYLDFFPVLDEVFDAVAREAGVDTSDEWSPALPEVESLMSLLMEEGYRYLGQALDQGYLQRDS